MDKQQAAFKEEASELLNELETALLELEQAPEDKGIISRVFRAMHTIKGSGAMFGFDEIASFCHEVESVLDRVRSGKLPATVHLINLVLAACDHINTLLNSEEAGNPATSDKANHIIKELQGLSSVPGQPVGSNPTATDPPVPSPKAPDQPHLPDRLVTYRIRFNPSAKTLQGLANPQVLLQELKNLGTINIYFQHDAHPRADQIQSEKDRAGWDILLTTDQGINPIKDVFFFVEDANELCIETIAQNGQKNSEGYKKLGEILVEKGEITQDDLGKALLAQKRVGELLVESGVVNSRQIESALAEQQHVKTVREKREQAEPTASIRVPSDKLDCLVNLVGEMVTVQARLSQTAGAFQDERLDLIAEEVERLTEELRANTMGIRMLQIGSTFSKFKRLVRDLSQELGKEIELTTEGAETELDKTIIEKLDEPLVHLIRNCIDHGIELPEERVASGKSKIGTVHLAAIHSGAHVLVRISDDGRGLDPQVLKEKAVEKGLLSSDAMPSELELFSLIFSTGFSTATTVNHVSGRGVGMDVVKRSIEALRGAVEIESRKGQGTTITLKLPLTLAIIDGFLVRVAKEYFVIPLHLVGECIEFTPEDKKKVQGGNIINVRNQAVPFMRLRTVYGINGAIPEIEHMVIVEAEGNRVGFLADQIIGEHKTVLKNLGSYYKNIDGISGGTILGDGSVSLIIDINKLLHKIKQNEGGYGYGFDTSI